MILVGRFVVGFALATHEGCGGAALGIEGSRFRSGTLRTKG